MRLYNLSVLRQILAGVNIWPYSVKPTSFILQFGSTLLQLFPSPQHFSVKELEQLVSFSLLQFHSRIL